MTHRNLLCLGLGLAVCQAHAVSFRLPNQDPEAIARGNAFVATASNPSAIYYNPAGITQLEGQQLNVGAYFVSAHTEYTGPFGFTAKTDAQFQPVPQIYYVLSPKDSAFSYGFGLYAPYGLGLDWGNTTAPLRFLGQKGKVLYASANPEVAWQITETLSIGAGPTINYSQASFHQPLTPPLGEFNFKGDGADFGFNAGLLWKPHPKLAFGINYRHETEIEYDGHSEFTPLGRTDTKGSLPYPRFVVAGVSFRPTENWNFEFDIDWTDWDSVNSVQFVGATFPATLVFNHRSSFMYEFGITRQLPNGYFVSGGYFYSENSVPDATFNPLIPDSNLHLGSVGLGHKGESWDWAIAYHFATNGEGRTVTGSPLGLADGRYETLNHGVNVSAVFKF